MRISPLLTSRRDAVARQEDEGGKLLGVHVEITIDPFHNHMNAALHQEAQDIRLLFGGAGQGNVEAETAEHIPDKPAAEPFAARVEEQDAEQGCVAFNVV